MEDFTVQNGEHSTWPKAENLRCIFLKLPYFSSHTAAVELRIGETLGKKWKNIYMNWCF